MLAYGLIGGPLVLVFNKGIEGATLQSGGSDVVDDPSPVSFFFSSVLEMEAGGMEKFFSLM